MRLINLLSIALSDSVSQYAALESLESCKSRMSGVLRKKLFVRWFKASWIADQLSWENNRLIEVHPDLGDWDIEPVDKVTSHGDNGPWDSSRPIQDCWLNKDPDSVEYQDAVASCYWSKGNHPRSKKGVKAQYRRNGGAGYVYRLGCPVDEAEGLKIWRGTKGRTSVVVLKSGDAWQLYTYTTLIGSLKFMRRVGFEVNNVFSGTLKPQAWHAIPQAPILKAPISWSPIGFTLKPVYQRKDHWPGVEQTPVEP